MLQIARSILIRIACGARSRTNLEIWHTAILKTTLEIPDDLYRAVKAKAAIEGRRVTDVVIVGLRMAIDGPVKAEKRVELQIVKAKKGARS